MQEGAIHLSQSFANAPLFDLNTATAKQSAVSFIPAVSNPVVTTFMSNQNCVLYNEEDRTIASSAAAAVSQLLLQPRFFNQKSSLQAQDRKRISDQVASTLISKIHTLNSRKVADRNIDVISVVSDGKYNSMSMNNDSSSEDGQDVGHSQELNISSTASLLKSNPIRKSFTIDSLLGLNNVAARAAFRNGFVNPSQVAPVDPNVNPNCFTTRSAYSFPDSRSDSSKMRVMKSKEGINYSSRIHPYASNSKITAIHSSKCSKSLAATSNERPSCNENDPVVKRAGKTKRVRTIFTPEQLERLEAEFERQQYMVGPERLYLASSLHLTEAQVKVWFQNRRIKWRKQHLEMQQKRLAALRSQAGIEIEEKHGMRHMESIHDSDDALSEIDGYQLPPSMSPPPSTSYLSYPILDHALPITTSVITSEAINSAQDNCPNLLLVPSPALASISSKHQGDSGENIAKSLDGVQSNHSSSPKCYDPTNISL